MWSLKADDDGSYTLGAYETYLLNIILRWSAEEDLAENDTVEIRTDLSEINADLAMLNIVLSDAERGRALTQLGEWSKGEGWLGELVGKLANTITACRVGV